MEELALLGNAAAVPVIIGITQFVKKSFSFKYKADVVSAFVSLAVVPLWWFYNTPEVEIHDALDDGIIPTLKFGIQLFLISVATWLSATKSYDLFSGNKKRQVKHSGEKEELQGRIKELEVHLENGGPADDSEDDNEISDKLLEILEGRD